jgi:hypothetical protein
MSRPCPPRRAVHSTICAVSADQTSGYLRGVDKGGGYGVLSLGFRRRLDVELSIAQRACRTCARERCPGCGDWPRAECQGTGQMTATRVVRCAVTVTDSGKEHGFSHSVPLSSRPLSVTAAPLLSVMTAGERPETR